MDRKEKWCDKPTVLEEKKRKFRGIKG